MSKVISEVIKKRRPSFNQYLIPFYKERNVNPRELVKWFRLYNYFNSNYVYNFSKSENFIRANYSPSFYQAGVTFVGNGRCSLYIKYTRWLTAKNRIIVEFGQSTISGWYLDERVATKSYNHVSESMIKSACDKLSDREIELFDFFGHPSKGNEFPKVSFLNSIKLIDFKPPYAAFDVICQADLIVANLIFKLIELLDCPIQLIDADRYELEGIKATDCLTKTDIYRPYITESRYKYMKTILSLLKKHEDKEQLKLPTHGRYRLYA